MHYKTSIAAIALTTVAAPALADLTAADVWADFQAYAETTGMTLSAANESMSGDTLTLSGVTFSSEMPDGNLQAVLGDLSLTERSDGTVAVNVPDEYNIAVNMSFEDDAADEGTFNMVVRQTELEMIASGTPEQTLYTYSAPQVSVSLDAVAVDGETVPADFDATFTALSGEYELTDGDPIAIRSVFNAGELSMLADVAAPPGEDGAGRFSLAMAGLSGTSTGTMANISAMAGLGEMIEDGMVSNGDFGFERAAMEASGGDGNEEMEIRVTTGSGGVTFDIGPDGLAYSGEANALDVSAAGTEIPIPNASFGIERYNWAVDVPILVSEEVQDFSMSFGLNGLTLSDMIWAMFDPGGAIPRDPANLAVDLAGRGRWLLDITDPDLGSEPMEQMPGEVETLTINDLELSVAGAELTGDGDFTFVNSGDPAVPPIPAGAINLQLVGGNSLIDKLVGMGLLPEDQAMGARMMLGLFARPGEGEDTLVSTIEFTPEGGIIANGQPLR